MAGLSYVCNQTARTFKQSYRNPNQSKYHLEFKKQFSISANSFSSTKNSFSYRSLLERYGRQKFWHDVKAECNEKLAVFGEILTEQFNFYASQRIRRMSQIWNLYTRLYTEKTLHQIVSQFARNLQGKKKRPLTLLLGVALFSWEKEKITNDEIESCICELDRFHSPEENSSQLPKIYNCGLTDKLVEEGWETVIKKDCLQLWRKSFENSYLYEYKIIGTFLDVPARAFFCVQTDIEYRKKWDKLVIKLDIIDKEDNAGCEVIHWVMHYPYPMYSRDYVYIRRAVVNPETNTMVLVSRAIEHPLCPVNNKYVRVTKYSSRMVIRPHSTFDENGFDYVLTYFDDPQAAFPSPAYSWMASSGVPDFVERLHTAARELHYNQRRNKTSLPASKSSNKSCPAGDMEYAYV